MRTLLKLSMIIALLLVSVPALAQEDASAETAQQTSVSRTDSWRINGLRFEPQKWNNCGPATLTNALSFFGYGDNQDRAADWLKPNYEDKNVSPDQMAAFVNSQIPELNVRARLRYGGNQELLKQLVFNNFPVIIEKGYDPEPDRLGWMGHYLLIVGYDDAQGTFTTHDSYIGAYEPYSYEYITEYWQHFNYTYLVLYEAEREAELDAVLGTDADPYQNMINAFRIAQAEAEADQNDPFAWFNMGTNLVMLGLYEDAAYAYDIARGLGLPWRMLWYQFGPYEAYYQTGRYDDVLTLARGVLNDGGGHFVEETFYYGGLAREALGETERALSNYLEAARFNPNFSPAVEARNRLQSGG